MAKKTANKLLNLPPDVSVTGVQTHYGCDVYSISFPEAERICPGCNSTHCVIKDSSQQIIRHVPSSGRPVFLSFKRHRYACRECGKTFSELPEWMHPSLRMSSMLYFNILMDLTDLVPVSIVASNNCITEAVVNDVLATIPLNRPEKLPHTLCIDEFKGDSGIWNPKRKRWDRKNFQVAIVDGEAGTVIDVLPDTLSKDIKNYFFQFPLPERKRVEFFCCDMHNGYTSVAKACFPDAVICIDRFHVINRLNSAIDDIRRRLQNEADEKCNTELYHLLKRTSKSLLTKQVNQEKLWLGSYERKMEQLDYVLSACPDLSEAYDAVQEFHNIAAMSQYTLQRASLSEWLGTYLSSEVPELRAAATTIKHWRGYIQNAWKYDRSNGPCEGLNNKIKVLKRISFGVHDFDSFRRKILLTCGYVHKPKAERYSLRQLLPDQAASQNTRKKGGRQ